MKYLLIISAVLLSCISVAKPKQQPVYIKNSNIHDDYKIYVDRRFKLSKLKILTAALNKWKLHTSLKFHDVEFKDGADFVKTNIETQNNVIYISYTKNLKLNKNAVMGLTTTNIPFNASIIEIDEDCYEFLDDDILETVFQHELGHAFGIGHTDQFYFPSVMISDVSSPYSTMQLQPIDLFLYCIKWHCKIRY